MLIYANRGASADFPEGTKAAYEAAITQGADGFECDVRLSKDQQIICYHDSNTSRLSGVNLEIAKTDFAILKMAVNPYLLSELLDLAIGNKKNLAIDWYSKMKVLIKNPAAKEAIDKRIKELKK